MNEPSAPNMMAMNEEIPTRYNQIHDGDITNETDTIGTETKTSTGEYYLNSYNGKRKSCHDSISCDKKLTDFDAELIKKLDFAFRNSHVNMPEYDTQVKTHIDHHLIGYKWHDFDYKLSMRKLTEALQDSGKIVSDLILNAGHVWLKVERCRTREETYISQGDMDLTPGYKSPSGQRYLDITTSSVVTIIENGTESRRKRRKTREYERVEDRLPKTPPSYPFNTEEHVRNACSGDGVDGGSNINRAENTQNWSPIFNPSGINEPNLYDYYGTGTGKKEITLTSNMRDDLHLVDKIIDGSEEESRMRIYMLEEHMHKINDMNNIIPDDMSILDKKTIVYVHKLFHNHHNDGVPLFSSIVVNSGVHHHSLKYDWKDELFLVSALDLYKEMMYVAKSIIHDISVSAKSISIKINKSQ